MNRRRFIGDVSRGALGITAGAALPAWAAGSGVPARRRATPTLASDEIELRIGRTAYTIDGVEAPAVTINGSIPGPLVRLREGVDATLRVVNELDEPTSIHWHGLLVPPEMDGVPGVSFAGIPAGETFEYRYPVKQYGTYWYHSHSGLQEQLGHYGPLIIDPAEPEPFAYDRDHVVVLSDWTFENPYRVLARLKKQADYYNFQQLTVPSLFDNDEPGFGERLQWGRMRMLPTELLDVTGATYTFLMNGMAPADNWSALYRPGEKVRLRLINAAAATLFDVRVPGLELIVVQVDGQDVEPVAVDELRLAPAETYDVIVAPAAEDAYTIFAEAMDRSGFARGTLAPRDGMSAGIPPRRPRPVRTMADMGMAHGDMSGTDMQQGEVPGTEMDHAGMPGMEGAQSTAQAAGHEGHAMPAGAAPMPPPVPHGPDDHGAGNAGIAAMPVSRLHEPGTGLGEDGRRVLLYADLRAIEPLYEHRPPDREIELHATGNMERYMWSFDGKKFSQVDGPIRFVNGERLRLNLVNDTMMEHPIHLHGMWFHIVNGNGAHNPRKHTVNLKPAERMLLDIEVDAPGSWAFHCHILYHMDAGMFRVVRVDDPVAASDEHSEAHGGLSDGTGGRS